MTTTYEAALKRIAGLEPATSEHERLVDWIDGTGKVGVARTNGGRIELFFVGPELDFYYWSIVDLMVHKE